MRTIFVLTGGGVAPALNPTLYGVIQEAKRQNFRILGGIKGWASLVENAGVIELTDQNIEPIKNQGGTFLKTSRTNPFKKPSSCKRLRRRVKELEVDAIVAIGGDDTLGAACRLYQEFNLPLVGIPKTIDNDLAGTFWTPGYPTAAYHMIRFVKAITRTAYATGKIYIVECFGGKAGWLTATAALGGAKIMIVPERKINLEHLFSVLSERYKKFGFLVIAISHTADLGWEVKDVCKGKKDQFGIQRKYLISLPLRQLIEERTGTETKVAFPGNFFSALDPIKRDRDVAIELGKKAVQLISGEQFGQMVCLKESDSEIDISAIPLQKAVSQYRCLEERYFDFERYLPTDAFREYLGKVLKVNFFAKNSYNNFLSKLK